MITVTLANVATAIATTLATKAIEKIGENIGDTAWTTVPGKLQNAAQSLKELLFGRKNKLPLLISAIEGNQPQRLDYGQAVRELTEAAQDPEIAQAIMDVEAAVNNDQSETAEKIKKLADEIKSHPSVVKNFTKMAETIKAEKGATVAQNIENFTQNNTYN